MEGIPPAVEPVSYRIWLEKATPAGPGWQFLGFLLDSPEPLFHPGRTKLKLISGRSPHAIQQDFSLGVNASGTRALIWSPGLPDDSISLNFTLRKATLSTRAKQQQETAVLQTYVLKTPGAYQEEN
jgi:hypothetical protein